MCFFDHHSYGKIFERLNFYLTLDECQARKSCTQDHFEIGLLFPIGM